MRWNIWGNRSHEIQGRGYIKLFLDGLLSCNLSREHTIFFFFFQIHHFSYEFLHNSFTILTLPISFYFLLAIPVSAHLFICQFLSPFFHLAHSYTLSLYFPLISLSLFHLSLFSWYFCLSVHFCLNTLFFCPLFLSPYFPTQFKAIQLLSAVRLLGGSGKAAIINEFFPSRLFHAFFLV